MKKNQSLVAAVLMLFVVAITACSSPQKKLSDEIEAKEKSLYGDSTMVPDAGKAKEVITLYVKYADEFPEDTASASYLFKAGDVSSKINETQQAIEIFGRLIQKYPEHSNAPFALFLQGFIYENQVGDPAKARPYYESFLKKYPDHPIASDVSFSLENLGKTPEQLIQEFESKSQDQELSSGDSTKVSTAK